jgi:hypothetical protein
MKKIAFLLSLLPLSTLSNAQEFQGFRYDNYNGAAGVHFNPAVLADHPYYVDVNIFNVSANVGNSMMKFDFNKITKGNNDGFFDQFIANNQLNSLNGQLGMSLPSVSFRVSKKFGIAITNRVRTMFNVRDFDGGLYNSIKNNIDATNFYPYNVNSNANMRIDGNVFMEAGVGLGYTVFENSNHKLKLGITPKIVLGVANMAAQINQLNGTLNEDQNGDDYITDTRGTIRVNAAGVELDDTENIKLKTNSVGFAMDFGAIYEYISPKYKELLIPYKFKVGVSILDVGSIKYNSLPDYTFGYNVHIPNGDRFMLKQFDGKDMKEIKEILNNNPQYFTKIENETGDLKYKVGLPRQMHLNLDYRLTKNIFVTINGQLDLSNAANKFNNIYSYNAITISPRYEARLFGVYLPFSMNNITQTMNIGAGLRLGPLYAGSSNIISIVSKETKSFDFYLGLHVGLKPSKKKIKRLNGEKVNTELN